MAQYNLASAYVNPTAADVAASGSAGFGRCLMESTFGKLLTGICGKGGWILEGFAPPSPGASINNYGYTGSAVVSGYLVKTTNNCYVSFPASSTVYCYLKLNREAWGTEQLVTQAVIDVVTTEAQADDACLLWIVTTGPSTVSSVVDYRLYHSGLIAGRYTGTGTDGRTVTIPELDTRYPTAIIVADFSDTPTKWCLVVRFHATNFISLKYTTGTGLEGGINPTTTPTPTSGGIIVDQTTDEWNQNSLVYHYLVLA